MVSVKIYNNDLVIHEDGVKRKQMLVAGWICRTIFRFCVRPIATRYGTRTL